MTAYVTKQPGDVLLDYDLPYCPAGEWVLLSIGDTCCLSRLGVDAQDMLCCTSTMIWVPIADLCQFERIRLRAALLGLLEP